MLYPTPFSLVVLNFYNKILENFLKLIKYQKRFFKQSLVELKVIRTTFQLSLQRVLKYNICYMNCLVAVGLNAKNTTTNIACILGLHS